jgi:predicted  nucleic acid-binding Zn-ribbon protein
LSNNTEKKRYDDFLTSVSNEKSQDFCPDFDDVEDLFEKAMEAMEDIDQELKEVRERIKQSEENAERIAALRKRRRDKRKGLMVNEFAQESRGTSEINFLE